MLHLVETRQQRTRRDADAWRQPGRDVAAAVAVGIVTGVTALLTGAANDLASAVIGIGAALIAWVLVAVGAYVVLWILAPCRILADERDRLIGELEESKRQLASMLPAPPVVEPLALGRFRMRWRMPDHREDEEVAYYLMVPNTTTPRWERVWPPGTETGEVLVAVWPEDFPSDPPGHRPGAGTYDVLWATRAGSVEHHRADWPKAYKTTVGLGYERIEYVPPLT